VHSPPLVYHIEHDPGENFPLDPKSAEYQTARLTIETAANAHRATVTQVPNQMAIPVRGAPRQCGFHWADLLASAGKTQRARCASCPQHQWCTCYPCASVLTCGANSPSEIVTVELWHFCTVTLPCTRPTPVTRFVAVQEWCTQGFRSARATLRTLTSSFAATHTLSKTLRSSAAVAAVYPRCTGHSSTTTACKTGDAYSWPSRFASVLFLAGGKSDFPASVVSRKTTRI
jgi:hypothetical protein